MDAQYKQERNGDREMKILGEHYRVDELAAEAGRIMIFLLAGGAWTFFLLMLVVD